MSDFVSMLTERRDAARKRVEELMEALQAAQEEAETWEAALAAESSRNGNLISLQSVAEEPPMLIGFTRKEELVRKALESHGPLKSAQIIKMLYPTVSQAHVYYSLERMKERGEVEKGKDQRYTLAAKSKEESA